VRRPARAHRTNVPRRRQATPRAPLQGGVPAAAQSTPPATALVDLAAAIVAGARETRYSYDTTIDAAQGIDNTDCSGFVGYLLERVAPAQLALVPKEPGQPLPRAFKYQEFFADLAAGRHAPGWEAVTRLADAQPGDILAWALLPIAAH
jgi:cell wall-associated NlpC family hydrolase